MQLHMFGKMLCGAVDNDTICVCICIHGHIIVFRNELRKSLDHAQSRTNTASQSLNANFWSAHQRFFKQLWYCLFVCTCV